MKSILNIALLFIVSWCNAQDALWYTETWKTVYNIAATPEGEVIVIGGYKNEDALVNGVYIDDDFNTDEKITPFIAKYSTDGKLLWKKSGTSYRGWFGEMRGINLDNENNIICSGEFKTRIGFCNEELVAQSGKDMFVYKFSENGDCLWSKRFGSYGGVVFGGTFTDKEQNVYVKYSTIFPITFDGQSYGSAGTRKKQCILKLNPDGDVIWFYEYKSDIPGSVSAYPDGGYIICGLFGNYLNIYNYSHTFNTGDMGQYYVHLSPDADVLNFYFINDGNDKVIRSFSVDKQGNLYNIYSLFDTAVFGKDTVNIPSNDRVLVKYDNQANYLWNKVILGEETHCPFWTRVGFNENNNPCVTCGEIEYRDSLNYLTFEEIGLVNIEYNSTSGDVLNKTIYPNLTYINSYSKDRYGNMYTYYEFFESMGLTYNNSVIPDAQEGTHIVKIRGEFVQSNSSFVLYPNPSTNNYTLQIDSEEKDNYSIMVYNALGQLVYTNEAQINGLGEIKIDASSWRSGVYYAEILSSSETEFIQLVKL